MKPLGLIFKQLPRAQQVLMHKKCVINMPFVDILTFISMGEGFQDYS